MRHRPQPNPLDSNHWGVGVVFCWTGGCNMLQPHVSFANRTECSMRYDYAWLFIAFWSLASCPLARTPRTWFSLYSCHSMKKQNYVDSCRHAPKPTRNHTTARSQCNKYLQNHQLHDAFSGSWVSAPAMAIAINSPEWYHLILLKISAGAML